MSHPVYALLLALLVSGAAAIPGDRPARERAYVGAYIFLACVVSIFGGGWFMYLVHG